MVMETRTMAYGGGHKPSIQPAIQKHNHNGGNNIICTAMPINAPKRKITRNTNKACSSTLPLIQRVVSEVKFLYYQKVVQR